MQEQQKINNDQHINPYQDIENWMQGNLITIAVSFNSNEISDEEATKIATAIRTESGPVDIKFFSTPMSSFAISQILGALHNNNYVESLTMKDVGISFDDGKVIAELLINNSKLQYLDISNNNLGMGIYQVGRAFDHNKTLRTININNNGIKETLCSLFMIKCHQSRVRNCPINVINN